MLFLFWVLQFILLVAALKHIGSSSLLTCMDNSQLTASYFNVVYYPHNTSIVIDVSAISNINANVSANIELITYGLSVLTRNITLCNLKALSSSLCPLSSGHLDIQYTYNATSLKTTLSDSIPGVAYTIPDLDARVRVVVYNSDTKEDLACVEATLSNGKTVQTKYAAWPIAAIAGLGVITSGVISITGHSNTAAHIASNSMSLFVYFQSLAITSMLAVAKTPPIAAAWSQNFMWSLGIIKTNFIQTIANWYLQSTGGTPTDVFDNTYLSISVQKVKRGMEYLTTSVYNSRLLENVRLAKRISVSLDSDKFGYSDTLNLTLYTTNEKDDDGTRVLVLRGVQRVAYLAGIEITNFYMTAIIFLLFFAFVVVACMTFFKAIVEISIRAKWMNEGKFNEYRQQWSSVLKGSLYRLLLISLPQVAVLSLWEFTVHDSAGIVVVAVILLAINLGLLIYAAFRVISFGRRSIMEHRNPAYLLYGDGKFLNRFGFVYVQYRADCFYWVSVSLVYVVFKTLFVAVLQAHGRVQSVIVFVIELIHCVLVCWIRPFMDKRTNIFNITIAVVNTINALFFMFFSYVFNQPQVVSSVMAVVYFILNAVFALFLLIFTIVTCVLALVYKNPDTRYQPMKDDRVSFLPRIGGKGKLEADGADDIELVALGASAMRGHENGGKAVEYADDESVYDESSSQSKKKVTYGSPYADTESFSRNSLAESVEPQQVASTLVGNSTNAYSSFPTSYSGNTERQNAPYNGYYGKNHALNSGY